MQKRGALRSFLAALGLAFSPTSVAASTQSLLEHPILTPGQAGEEAATFIERHVARLPEFSSREKWAAFAEQTRRTVLDEVVFRGAAEKWRKAPLNVVWLETIPGGPGYHIRKLRYEAVPGLWIPALLYEPDSLPAKTAVMLDVNGHEPAGKAAAYEQLRDINLVKRGLLVLHPEWLGMGQLRAAGYDHGRMNQLDLCGTSGLAVFYLAMQRGLDVLLTLPQADPQRVAVSGLSGGGWQTILLSALDPRVTLSNPVAGYSSLATRARHHKDLGDSEQMPTDLGHFADYPHLTALRAPRPTLLTYNSKDDCCFESGYALPPLTQAAAPIYRLIGGPDRLRTHINDDPGTHNFLVDNREALYAMLRDHFFAGRADFPVREIPSYAEVKTIDQLRVEIPTNNATFNSLARVEAAKLSTGSLKPTSSPSKHWQSQQRRALRQLIRATNYVVAAEQMGASREGDNEAMFWRLRLGNEWTIPVTELTRGKPVGTVILVGDGGRRSLGSYADRLLANSQRVLAVDPSLIGECRVDAGGYLFSLLIDCVGARSLGVEASQLTAVARWADERSHSPALLAVGPRMAVAGLTAAALEPQTIRAAETVNGRSLRSLITEDRSIGEFPELFCFGILRTFDLRELEWLVAPRPSKALPTP